MKLSKKTIQNLQLKNKSLLPKIENLQNKGNIDFQSVNQNPLKTD